MTSSLLAGSELQEQINLESTAVQNGVARYHKLRRDAVRRGRGAQLKPVERMMVAWIPHLTEEIRKLKRQYLGGIHADGIAHWGPILALADPEQAAFIAMDKTLGLCLQCEQELGDAVSYTTVATAIGAAIVAQINLTHTVRLFRAKAKALRDELAAKGLDEEAHNSELKTLRKNARRERAMLDNIMDRSDAAKQINRHARRTAPLAMDNAEGRASLGARILSLIVREVAMFPRENDTQTADDILAFKIETIKFQKKRLRRIVKLRDKTRDFIATGHQTRQRLRPVYLPMIVPPYRRDRSVPGGYITLHTPFVTKSTPEQQDAYKAADLSFEYDALEAIGATPFRIFSPLLDVCRTLREQGGGVLSVPPSHDGDRPARPELADTDPEIEKAWKQEAGRWYDQRVANCAAREEFGQAMAVADLFEHRKVMYFPHHNDFRGRVYPIPKHLNSHGPDLYRALLCFANHIEPDTHWVAVHVANCAGFDKVGFDDRAAWARDWSADHSVQRWIGKTSTILDHMDEWGNEDEIDSPWQFLAGLIAMHKPEWAARLPVQFDGAANGLQHYAMLTRDESLAEIVNLTPADKPAGIYLLIAARVRQILLGETSPLAAILLPMIDKDIVKQPTMTTVYGVTFSGAQEQIMNTLGDKGVAEEHRYEMASYLTHIVLRAIEGVCGRAAPAMEWLRESARAITATGEPYSLTSPSGLPMIQPDRRWHVKKISVMEGMMSIILRDRPCPIARGDQIRGAAPNTIHSIDQAHMKRVAVRSYASRIDNRFNHDGFSCHSGNVRIFKPIVHEEFVNLHRTDWFATFHAEWKAKHPKAKLPDPPERGWFDIEQVLDAPYAFH
jgi:DNA-directed RNA polymerase